MDKVKEEALSFHRILTDSLQENEKSVDKLRIKVIVFRNYRFDSEPMQVSDFFTIPDQYDALAAFVNGIEAKGGRGHYANALEAIALAMKSEWTTEGCRRRHVILVYTDKAANMLGAGASIPNYPADMPVNLATLGSWWEGKTMCESTYNPSVGRMVVFAPKVYPWVDLQAWNRYLPAYSKAGTGLTYIDMQCVIDYLVEMD